MISRWVPAPERRSRPRQDSSEADTYRELLAEPEPGPASHRWLKGGAMLATIGLGSWLLRRQSHKDRTD